MVVGRVLFCRRVLGREGVKEGGRVVFVGWKEGGREGCVNVRE